MNHRIHLQIRSSVKHLLISVIRGLGVVREVHFTLKKQRSATAGFQLDFIKSCTSPDERKTRRERVNYESKHRTTGNKRWVLWRRESKTENGKKMNVRWRRAKERPMDRVDVKWRPSMLSGHTENWPNTPRSQRDTTPPTTQTHTHTHTHTHTQVCLACNSC